jgi:hypothetical protein
MKLITVVLATLSLTVCAHAQIGRTLEECRQSYGYGKPSFVINTYDFCGPKTDIRGVRYFITAFFVDGKVSIIYYAVNDPLTDNMYIEDAGYLLKISAPEVVWGSPSTNAGKTEMTWSGSVSGAVQYTAHFQGTRVLKIVDEATNSGGVIGAKREMMDGHEVTVLPTPTPEE